MALTALNMNTKFSTKFTQRGWPTASMSKVDMTLTPPLTSLDMGYVITLKRPHYDGNFVGFSEDPFASKTDIGHGQEPL